MIKWISNYFNMQRYINQNLELIGLSGKEVMVMLFYHKDCYYYKIENQDN